MFLLSRFVCSKYSFVLLSILFVYFKFTLVSNVFLCFENHLPEEKNEMRSGLSELQIDNKSSSQFPEEKTKIEHKYMYVEPVERTIKKYYNWLKLSSFLSCKMRPSTFCFMPKMRYDPIRLESEAFKGQIIEWINVCARALKCNYTATVGDFYWILQLMIQCLIYMTSI